MEDQVRDNNVLDKAGGSEDGGRECFRVCLVELELAELVDGLQPVKRGRTLSV